MNTRPLIYSTLVSDPDFQELVDEFVSNIPERLQQVEKCIVRGDHAGLCTLVHQLRGACGSYGFEEITPIATELELTLRSGATFETWQSKMVEFVDACRRMTASAVPLSGVNSGFLGSPAGCPI